MSANSFGELFKITSFGESHGPAMGVIIEGCPAEVKFQEDILWQALERRRPGQGDHVSGRNEKDEYEILSGVFEGKTLGTPIAVIVKNRDARSADYDEIRRDPRPGHADDVWKSKFGHADHRGGGRASGRETLSRVIGGAFAEMFVKQAVASSEGADEFDSDEMVSVRGCATQIGPHKVSLGGELTSEIQDFLVQAKSQGKSYGGRAKIEVRNVPINLGQPVFKKIKSELAAAMMSVGATSSFELGAGHFAAEYEGTEFHTPDSDQSQYGGVRGGITTGEPISFVVSFKPTSSVMDVAKKGRHDPCIVPRAIPVLEAMTWLVLADQLLWQRLDRI